VFRLYHLLFFDRAHQALGTAILFGFSNSCHADLDAMHLQQIDIIIGSLLHALIAVMDVRLTGLQFFSQSR
jgi:hypothetical protein